MRAQLHVVREHRRSVTGRIDHGDRLGDTTGTEPIDNIANVESERAESSRRRQRANELVSAYANTHSLLRNRIDMRDPSRKVQELPRRIYLKRPQHEVERQLLVAFGFVG